MARLGKSANTRAFLGGVKANMYKDWEKVGIRAVFGDKVQPVLDIDTIILVNKEAQRVRNYLLGGLDGSTPGIFEGMPWREEVYNIDASKEVFNGILDFTKGFKDFDPEPRVECVLRALDGQDNLQDRLEAITFGYLEEIGAVTSEDYTEVDYQVITNATFIEILIANVMLFLLLKELSQAIKDTADAIANAIGHLSGGITGSIAAAIFAIAIAIIQIIYLAIISKAIIGLVRDIINNILPPLRQCQTIKFNRSLEIVSTHLGYTFVSPIDEFNNLYYLPSNLNLDVLDGNTGTFKKIRGTEKGIPHSSDFGYTASEMFQTATDMFTADKAVIDGELQLRAENDPWWFKQSTWVSPSHIPPTTEYNTDELIGDKIIAFQTDLKDEWTINNFKGTNFEVITDAITTNDPRAKSIKGQQTTNINVSLGNVKEELTALEKIIAGLAKFADNVIKGLGGVSDLAKAVNQKKSVLKISQNDYARSKLIWLDGSGKVPSNHRELFSAKVMYEKYGSFNSFVDNNFNGQKVIHNSVRMPFGFVDFCQLTENSFFTTHKGEKAKATEFFWLKGEDTAEISYYIRKPYTKNLKEIKIEPDGS